jgi:lipoprotein-anchoring transpeptidase ErfK/SrfK
VNTSNKNDNTLSVPVLDVITDLEQRFKKYLNKPFIIIVASKQVLLLIDNNEVIQRYVISTAKAGLGNKKNSYQTPLGVHEISHLVGEDAKLGTIFKARVNTQKYAKILTKPQQHSYEDNITTRILWLNGLEAGVNHGDEVDTHERFIYIHGTDEEGQLGNPVSHGCIRMGNLDIIELFSKVGAGTLVNIIR